MVHSGRVTAAPTLAPDLEHELKFLVPVSAVPPLVGWLDGTCLRDRTYPPARVCTVYFDTPRLALLHEKLASDYLKTKVRLRWYADVDGRATGAVYAEAKRRVGTRRLKIRRRLDVAAPEAAARPLDDPAWCRWLDPIRAEAGALPAALAPVLALHYVRHRFDDGPHGSRVTVDERVAVDRVNPLRAHGAASGPLPIGVLEYKGRHADLPPMLAPILRFGARRGACSKYLAAWLHVTRTTL